MPRRKRKETAAPADIDKSLSSVFGGGGGSLTASLFGDTTTNNNDSIFGSSATTFDKAVQDRVEENKMKASKQAKLSAESDEESGDDAPPRKKKKQSMLEILARRTEQSEVPLIEDITCPPIYPANEESPEVLKAAAAAAALLEEGPLPLDVQIQETVDVVKTYGFAVVQNVVSKKMLETISKRVHEIEQQVNKALDDRNVSWRATQNDKTETFRFHEVASRCTGRMDLRHETDSLPFSDPHITANKSLIPIVHSLLGGATAREEAHMPILVYVGLIISLPGSDNQPWHQDGMPLFTEAQGNSDMPPYALNIFLPLTDDDASLESGPTEFIPGSHRLSEDKVMEAVDMAEEGKLMSNKDDDNDDELPGIAGPVLRQGDAMIYDYRVCHRGTSNITHRVNADGEGRVRKILYLMFARPWFKEHLNFGIDKLF